MISLKELLFAGPIAQPLPGRLVDFEKMGREKKAAAAEHSGSDATDRISAFLQEDSSEWYSAPQIAYATAMSLGTTIYQANKLASQGKCLKRRASDGKGRPFVYKWKNHAKK